jgi:hypothetical protein
MSHEAVAWLFERSKSKGATRCVLLAIAERAKRTGEVRP